MDNLSGQQIKGYELKQRIAAGGFGAVYRAQQSTVGREVAVKVILPGLANQPDFIRRFEAEAQLIARLEHHFIVPLYDYWRDPDGAYLVMRYLRGGSLHDYIRKQGELSIEEAFNLFSQVAQGLHVAHRNHVIHRDIKPGNILLDEEGTGFLADFGIAKDHTTTQNITEPDSFIGSPEYLAPEQARSEPVTPQTDIYSMGVILYEMLTGKHPFPNLEKIEIIFKHLNEPLPDITTLDDHICDDVNEVIQKATAKDPSRRFSDVIEMVEALRQAAQLDTMSTPTSPVELLTPREQEVMQLIIDGKTNREIADLLVLTEGTIKTYITRIYRKLNVRSRVQAIARLRDLDFLIQKPESSVSISTGHLPEPDNPYKGLRAFQAADAQDFFGREKLIQKLLRRLQDNSEHYRFLSVVGPSGGGKSSVVKAGLIPALWRGELPSSENWYIIDMVPGDLPLDELEVALLRVAGDKGLKLREQLERDAQGLLRVANIILPDDDSELLIVIDQFEEVFTLVEDEKHRKHFLDLLYSAVTRERSRVRIVVTLRADYYDRPLQYPNFGDLVRQRIETVLPLGAEQLERAIIEPANQAGVTFEDGLVSRIVSDIHYQPGALPLLQYALTELFERRDGRKLTLEAYEEIGGTGGALAKRADEIYLEGNEEARDLIRQLFLRLVTLGEGAEDTRRRAERTELLEIAGYAEMMDDIIDLYAESRLLSLDHDPATRQPTVELAHEAILREWDRLRQWLNESREDIRQERVIAHATEAWLSNNRDKSYLLTGNRLEQVEKWQASTKIAMTPQEIEFIQASLHQRETDVFAEQARQARETQLEQRARRFLRALAIGSFIAAILAIGLSVFAFTQQREAQRERDTAQQQADENQSLVWAFQAQSLTTTNTPLALRLALESIKIENPPPLALSIAQEIAYDDNVRYLINAHIQGIRSIAVSANGTRTFTGSCAVVEDTNCVEGEIAGWDLETGDELWRVSSNQGWINTVALSPDEATLLSGGCETRADNGACTQGSIITYNAESGATIQTLATFDSDVTSMQYSPDRNNLMIGTADGSLLRWDVETEIIDFEENAHNAAILSIDYDPTGTVVVAGDELGILSHWDMETLELIQLIDAHRNAINGIQLADTQTVITSSPDYSIKRWNLETGDVAETLALGDIVTNVIIDGESIYSILGLAIRKSSIFSLANEQDRFTREIFPIDFQNQDDTTDPYNRSSAIASDGSVMVVGNNAGIMTVWELGATLPINATIGSGYVEMAINPDGTRMALGTLTGGLEIWDIDLDSPTYLSMIHTLQSEVAGPGLVEFNADGSLIVWGVGDYLETFDSALYVVDATNGEIIQTFDISQHVATVRAINFLNDKQIITGSQDGNNLRDNADLIVWEIETGDMIQQFERDAILADVTDIAVKNDGYVFLSGATGSIQTTDGSSIRGFNLATGEVDRIYDSPHSTFGVQYIAETNQILSGTINGIAILWDADTTEIIRTFVLDNGWQFDTDVTSDGKYAVTASGTKTPALIDLESGTTVQVFEGHQNDNVWGVAFSPDDQTVWTSDMAGAIYQWSVEDNPLSREELANWISSNRYIHEPTCDVREAYRIEPLCDE